MWRFAFGEDAAVRLDVETCWRIIRAGRVVLTSEDDGQKFGLPGPIDAAETATETLSGAKATDLHIDRRTGDLKLSFGPDLILDVWTSSSGYENWRARFTTDGDEVTLIGGGGGALLMTRHPEGAQPTYITVQPLED